MSHRNLRLLLGAGFVAAFLVLLWRTAWLCEDSHITFRTVENFHRGLGLRWNPHERVQVYTHPLWMLLLVVARAIEPNVLYAALGSAMICSAAALAVVLAASRTWQALLVAGTVLLLSRSVVDYATAGLENPLSYLLVAGFAAVVLRESTRPRNLALPATLLLSLTIMTRHDLALLVGPAWLCLIVQQWRESRRVFGGVLLGLSPLVAWTAFSVVYYGFPLPNTAYAKLGHGIPQAELLRQGVRYLLHPLRFDPVTFWGVLLGVALLLWRGSARHRAAALGVVLTCAYLVKIGADYMAGRFLGAPLLLVVLAVATLPDWERLAGRRTWSIATVSVCVVALLALPFLTPYHHFLPTSHPPIGVLRVKDVLEDRPYFSRFTGLEVLQANRGRVVQEWADWGRQARKERQPLVVFGNVGLLGLEAGPGVTVVDYNGLTDPLLARIPAVYRKDWWIGHFQRAIPTGYLDSILSGENRLADPQLAQLYAHLRRVTDGPLWTAERWRSIYFLNFGPWQELADPARYRLPYRSSVKVEELPPAGRQSAYGSIYWSDSANVFLDPEIGLSVELGGIRHGRELALELSEMDTYTVEVRREGQPIARQDIAPELGAHLAQFLLRLPEEIAQAGYDELHIQPHKRMGGATLGALIIAGETAPLPTEGTTTTPQSETGHVYDDHQP